MAITCRASTEHAEMPQVVLLLKMPCDSTSWTGTQVATSQLFMTPCARQVMNRIPRNVTPPWAGLDRSRGRGILKEQLSRCYSIVYYYNAAQRYEQFLQVGRLYRALILLGLALSSERLCVFGLYGAVHILNFFCLHFSLYLLVSCQTWWDWPLTLSFSAMTLLVGSSHPWNRLQNDL